MTFKWIGAILIIAGCGGAGFSIASHARREEKYLLQFIDVVSFMENELQYRLTPLPEACFQAKEEADGVLRQVLNMLSKELERQVLPDPGSCMVEALRQSDLLPPSLRRMLLQLGHCLGRFDLDGQLCGLRSVRERCASELKGIHNRRSIQLRSYQTLGLCAGIALAILFM